MNRVILVGRLTKDPELKHTNTGISVVQFTVAVNRRYAGSDGNRQADFINCVVWRQAAENLAKYMKKGSLVGIEGQIQVRTYDDAGGVKRYVTEVICDNVNFLESKGQGGASGFNDVNQYDIPNESRNASFDNRNTSFHQEPKQENPFEDIVNSHNIDDSDLPF